MYITYDRNNDTYEFKDCSKPKDISKMYEYLDNLKQDPEVKYIASELGENLIKTKLKGDIRVNCKLVESIIYGKDKSKEAEMFINLAKQTEEQNENTKHKKHSGKGFISILRLGWKLKAEKISEEKYKVSAFK